MDTVQVLVALAVQAATAIGAARVHEHTELLATTDALTHLPNRRRLETDLAQEVAVSSRHSRPLAVAMIDVDHRSAERRVGKECARQCRSRGLPCNEIKNKKQRVRKER